MLLEVVAFIAVLQWVPNYKRAAKMQAPLAVIACLAGLGVAVL